MENNQGNESAYPTLDWSPDRNSGQITYQQFGGLTKREYFAGLAMQGILSNIYVDGEKTIDDLNLTNEAIRIADELLKQLSSK